MMSCILHHIDKIVFEIDEILKIFCATSSAVQTNEVVNQIKALALFP